MPIDPRIRSDFPVTRKFAYLDTAYIGPPPVPALAAEQDFLERRGAGTAGRVPDWLAVMAEVRGDLAALVNADPGEIALLTNASEGTNIVAGSLALRPGDNVVTDDLDYPSNQVIWHQFCAAGGATNRIVASRPAGRGATRGAAALADFAPLVDSRTRAISVAYVSHRNGYRHDLRGLAELAHAHGAILHVDASQAAGALQLDVAAEGIDTLTCGAGKWLLGPLGLAFFYAREALQPRLQSPLHGWMQVETYADPAHLLPGHLYRSARKFEAATVHFQGLYGWRASLRYLQNIGLATIEEHVLGLSARLWHGLAGLGVELLTPPGAASSIVSCRPPDLAALGRALERESIVASVRDDDIRFSPHFFNTAAEIDHVLAVVGRALPR